MCIYLDLHVHVDKELSYIYILICTLQNCDFCFISNTFYITDSFIMIFQRLYIAPVDQMEDNLKKYFVEMYNLLKK